jgi:hypothetical protein
MSNNTLLPLLWQHTLSGKCDAFIHQCENHKSEDTVKRKQWDIFSIRPSSAGMLFWDEYQKYERGNSLEQTGPRSLFASRRQKQDYDEKMCFCGFSCRKRSCLTIITFIYWFSHPPFPFLPPV